MTPEAGRTDRCATLQDPLTPPPAHCVRRRGSVTFDPQYRRNLPLKINLCVALTLFRGNSSFRTQAAGSSTVEEASQQGTSSEASWASTRHGAIAGASGARSTSEAIPCCLLRERLIRHSCAPFTNCSAELRGLRKSPRRPCSTSARGYADSCNKSVTQSQECRDRRSIVLGKQMREDQLLILIPNW